MAWSFRKRIKIAPGVHMNVGKNGPSFSVGGKGMSVTYGKNGTYLNSNIPGTGLRNRQKIADGKINDINASQFMENKKSENSGCLLNAAWLLSWIMLIIVTLLIFAFSSTWGIIFILGIVGLKIVINKKEEKPSEEVKQSTPLKMNISDEFDNRTITKDYFFAVTSEIEKIILFLDILCQDQDFFVFLKTVNGLNISIQGRTAKTEEQLRVLILTDMTKCLVELDHKVNVKEKECFGLFYFFCRTNGMDRFEYDKLDFIMKKNVCESVEDVIQQIISSINMNQPVEEIFLLSTLLKDYNTDLRDKYLVMLYRYASLTAKADGVVNEKESEWLSKILSLSEKNVNNTTENSSTIQRSKNQQKLPQLKSLIGLFSVKKEIESLTNLIKIQQEREAKGLKNSAVSYHCVFTGNPGTGKTTVARIVASIYKKLGILKKGHLVETDRSGLVAEYVGQTAVKTNKIIDSALDGVLFIDEAYSLISSSENDYGKEAVATLLKRLEDNRDRLVVILAGYSNEMQHFIDSNPGLQSRFNRYIEFPDYSADELYQIFEKNAKDFDYTISEEAEKRLKALLINEVANKDKNFGNARFVRNLFERTIERQANRLSKESNLTDKKLAEICSVDIPM
ncbi:MAG: DUF4236 domain-containing protein [Bacteroidales bacterium]|nr:DUF4236 domain-containing protein [Bacteroidales bacterium]